MGDDMIGLLEGGANNAKMAKRFTNRENAAKNDEKPLEAVRAKGKLEALAPYREALTTASSQVQVVAILDKVTENAAKESQVAQRAFNDTKSKLTISKDATPNYEIMSAGVLAPEERPKDFSDVPVDAIRRNVGDANADREQSRQNDKQTTYREDREAKIDEFLKIPAAKLSEGEREIRESFIKSEKADAAKSYTAAIRGTEQHALEKHAKSKGFENPHSAATGAVKLYEQVHDTLKEASGRAPLKAQTAQSREASR